MRKATGGGGPVPELAGEPACSIIDCGSTSSYCCQGETQGEEVIASGSSAAGSALKGTLATCLMTREDCCIAHYEE